MDATIINPSPLVTVSSRFQIVIPRRIREKLKLRPGDYLEIAFVDDVCIRMTPLVGEAPKSVRRRSKKTR